MDWIIVVDYIIRGILLNIILKKMFRFEIKIRK